MFLVHRYYQYWLTSRHHRPPQIQACRRHRHPSSPNDVNTTILLSQPEDPEDNTHSDLRWSYVCRNCQWSKMRVVSAWPKKSRSFQGGTSTSKLPKYGVYLYPHRPTSSLAKSFCTVVTVVATSVIVWQNKDLVSHHIRKSSRAFLLLQFGHLFGLQKLRKIARAF